MKTIHDADALLIYKVGPVYCCSPTFSVEAVMMPPKLSHPPGTSRSVPGVFRYVNGMVKVVDLRQGFGLAEDRWQQPGKIIVVEVESGRTGFWVDEILDVTEFPEQGWKPIGALIPRQVFSRTLLMNDKIHLYADFEKLAHFQESGYLREHIQQLLHKEEQAPSLADKNSPDALKKKDAIKNPQSYIKDKIKAPVKPAPSTPPANSSQSVYASKLSVEKGKKPGYSAGASGGLGKTDKIKTQRTEKLTTGNSNRTGTKKILATTKREPLKPARFSNSAEIKKADNVSRAFNAGEAAGTLPAKDKLPHYEARQKPADTIKSNHVFEWLAGFIVLAVLLPAAYLIYQPLGEVSESMPEYKNNMAASTLRSLPDKKAVDAALLSEQQGIDVIPSQKEDMPVSDHSPEIQGHEAEYQAKIEKDNKGVTIILSKGAEIPAEVISDTKAEITSDEIDLTQDTPIQKAQPSEKTLADKPPAEKTPVPDKMAEADGAENVKLAVKNIEPRVKRQEKPPQVIVHIVVKGDTLWHIAKKYVHNPFKYAELARLSKIKNPDLIYPGDRVRIIKLFKDE